MRLSLRMKLTLAFALAMAAVLAAMGLFVYLRVGGALQASVDRNLHAQASETAREVPGGKRPLVDPDTAGGPMLGQLVSADGRVLRSTPAGLPPLLDPRLIAQASDGQSVLRTAELPGRSHEWRVLAAPVGGGSNQPVLVLAASLSSRSDALDRLFIELLVAGPIALLLASLAGYALAALALRPVESMRRRAAAISASTPDERLPVPPGRDEIARLAETLNEMLARLQSAFEHERAAIEHERRFIADASHELRTPLTLLQTELDVALRRPRSTAELEAALRSAREETERLTRLAADLLLIARSDQGQMPLRVERVAVKPLLQVVADRFASRATELGRSVAVTGCEDVLVAADPVYLEQALGNMVDNALVHGRGSIELFARARDGMVELHVGDEGPGLPGSFMPRAFDRFSRADEARSGGGTGLGLSIVELIARAHGGEAGAANRAAGGADVWLAVAGGPGDDTVEPQPGNRMRQPVGA